MKRLALIAGALVMSSAAVAAEDTEVKHNGEFRVRYFNDMTPTAYEKQPGNKNDVEGRVKVGLTMRKGEKLQAHVTLLHNSIFGADKSAATSPNTTTGYNTLTQNNALLVNQAYGWWKASDSFAMKVGRFNVDIADGAFFSSDDWLSVPITHEGFQFGFDTDFAGFNLYLIKNADPLSGTGNPESDPEANTLLASMDLKNAPEAIKMANLHVALLKQSETTGTVRGSMDAQHIGLTVGGDMSMFMYKVDAGFQMGSSDKRTGVDRKLGGMMLDLTAGITMPETMGLKAWANYHMDSGDDNAADDKDETYLPLYYDSHKYAGRMDVLGWGNLTYWNIGASIAPADDLEVGLGIYGFTKTKERGSVNTTSRPNGTTIASGTLASKSDLGMEVDLWATKKYEGGFAIDATFGAFMPGQAFKDGAPKKEATIMQLMVAGTMTF